MVLSVKNICKSFGTDQILDNISFYIDNNEKVALVGVNGAGKTTLFKIITGELGADTGEAITAAGAQVGYMSQMLELTESNSIEQELLTVFSNFIAMEAEMQALSTAMDNLAGEALEEAVHQYTRLQEAFEAQNGYEYQSRVRGVINGLGFGGMGGMPVNNLSGGQKTRVCLGKLLLTAPDLLLLDEPTNHLDIESIEWLEDFLRSYSKALMVISHDRYFLDKVAGKVIEIENRTAVVYPGNYSYYAKQKETDRQIALKHFVDQQRQIKKQEESIKLLKSFNREKSIKRAESKEKQLAKLDRAARPEDLPEKIRIDLSPKIKSGDEVLKISALSKSFDEKLLFQHVDFSIQRGEKVALIGPNGIGKTTLFKIIMALEEASGGKVTLGHNVFTGYYDQYQQDLNPGKTLIEEISDAYPKMTQGEIRNMLAAFVFTGDDVFKKCGALSGGEKGRVALAKIMLSGANFLLLDEPTNHLDLYSKEILEDALRGYTGTLLFISHDRYFINSIANKILDLDQAGVTQYLGDYDYYLEKLKQAREDAVEAMPVAEHKSRSVKNDWAQKKEDEAKNRKIKNKIKNIHLEIEKTEMAIDAIAQELTKDAVSADHEKLGKLYMEKEELEEKLLKLYEELEQWENQDLA